MREEGLGALWKGALPRACWTAPLGAMNFAGAAPLHAALLVPWASSYPVSHTRGRHPVLNLSSGPSSQD